MFTRSSLNLIHRWMISNGSLLKYALVILVYASFLQAQTTNTNTTTSTNTTTTNTTNGGGGSSSNSDSGNYADLWYVPLIIVFVVLFFMIGFILLRNLVCTDERIHNTKIYKSIVKKLDERKYKTAQRKSMKKGGEAKPTKKATGAADFSSINNAPPTPPKSPPPMTQNAAHSPAYVSQTGSRVNQAYFDPGDELVEIGRF